MKIARKTTSRKQNKSKQGPKRPLTAYNFYFRDERVKILKERESGALEPTNGGFFSAMGKLVAKRWVELPPSEREHYEKLAKADRERYSKEMDEMVRR